MRTHSFFRKRSQRSDNKKVERNTDLHNTNEEREKEDTGQQNPKVIGNGYDRIRKNKTKTDEGETSKTNSRQLYHFLFCSFLDLLSFAVLIPVLPKLYQMYNVDHVKRGYILSAASLIQLVAGPILGSQSDKHGRVPLLVLSTFGSLLGYLCIYFNGVEKIKQYEYQFIFARLLPSLFKCNFSVGNAYVSDISTEKNRAKAMGQLSATFGLSFIIGPFLGALLVKDNSSLSSSNHSNDYVWNPVKVALLFSSIALVLQIFLPESKVNHDENDANKKTFSEKKNETGKRSVIERLKSNFQTLKSLSTNKVHQRIFSFLPRSVIQVLAGSIFQNNISNYCISYLGLPAHGTGYIMSYTGVLTVVNNIFFLRILKSKYTEEQLLLPSLLFYTFAMFCWGISSNVWHLLITITLLSTSGAVFASTSTSQITKSIPKDSLGEVFGITNSFETLARIIGPSLSTKLIDKYGYLGASRFSCFILTLCSIGIAHDKYKRSRTASDEEDEKKKEN